MPRILILLVLVICVSCATKKDQELMAKFQTDCAKYLNKNECDKYLKKATNDCRKDQECINDYLIAFELNVNDLAMISIDDFCQTANLTKLECFRTMKFKSEFCRVYFPEQRVEKCIGEIFTDLNQYAAKKLEKFSPAIQTIHRQCEAARLSKANCFKVTEMLQQVCKENSKCVNDIWNKARSKWKRLSNMN